MSKLLLNEQPLLIMPNLAMKIGLNESIVLQQIHYWNVINEKSKHNFKDGYYWTFNSYEEWSKQFPFWSKSTIQRTIAKLEKLKLIVVGNYNRLKIDRTKWYRINYINLGLLETSPFGQIDITNISDWHQHISRLTPPLPETSSKTSAVTNANLQINQQALLFIKTFESYFGYKHRTVKSVPYNNYVDDYCNEELAEIFVEYFDKYGTDNKKYNLEKCSIENVYASFARRTIDLEW
jgi:hypothetical protein